MWLLSVYTDLQQGNQMSFKELQDKAGLSNKEAADLLGVSLRTIQRWVKGDTSAHKSAMYLLQNHIDSGNWYGLQD